ncbi:hypothetical protein D3C87_181960 [compost metagenome]
MAFKGNEGEQITLEEGAAFTKRYRDKNPGAVNGSFIGGDHVQALLAQPDCQGLRVYLGGNEQGGLEFVFVGVDSNENDILDLIIERTIKCPPTCGGTNPLNSTVKG